MVKSNFLSQKWQHDSFVLAFFIETCPVGARKQQGLIFVLETLSVQVIEPEFWSFLFKRLG